MAQVVFIAIKKLVELFTAAERDGKMYAVLEKNCLFLGKDPLEPTHIIDFSNEGVFLIDNEDSNFATVSPIKLSPLAHVPEAQESSLNRGSRTTGKYYIQIMTNLIECRSLKEMLAEGLKALEQYSPGTLDKLSGITPRTKHIVSADRRHLVQKYSEKLVGDWWYGTNNSAQETQAWLKRATKLCGLVWGKDVTTSLSS